MSQQINSQVDVGGLSLAGLSVFSSLLATLSADGVTPTAMLQMEQLGTFFPVNGPKAARVPDLLQRCNSIKLDRLSLAIGWRKGDSASLMSQSASGQAISLLSMCIFSIFSDEDASDVLSSLCTRLLPHGAVLASLKQLCDVGGILTSKLEAMGFGTFLAEQAIRLHKVYEQLDMTAPQGLLERPSVDAAVDMLYNISRAVREPDILVRIVGRVSMGYIVALALILFPDDCLITVEGVIINSGARQTIHIELSLASNREEPTQIIVEEVLKRKYITVLPIIPQGGYRFGKFHWPGHLANYLDLHFVNAGLPSCPKDVRIALCDLLFSLPFWTEDIVRPLMEDYSLPDGGLISLLGAAPWHRMQEVWNETLGVTPSLPRKNLKDARREFLSLMSSATAAVPCLCSECPHNLSHLEAKTNISVYQGCPLSTLRRGVNFILSGAVLAVFVNPRENVVVNHFHNYSTSDWIFDSIYSEDNSQKNIDVDLYDAFINIFHLAREYGSCVLYPTELETLKKPSDLRLTFEMVDGLLVYNGRYYNSLTRDNIRRRPNAKESLIYESNKIIPSSIGEHSALTLSIRERMHALELEATLQGPSRAIRINLYDILKSSVGLVRTKACEHSIDCALEPEYRSKVRVTSVFEPCAGHEMVAIAQVKSNLEAQLLCCELRASCLLLSDCCLNCGVKEAIAILEAKKWPVILIVS